MAPAAIPASVRLMNVETSSEVLYAESGRSFDGAFARGADTGRVAVIILTEMFGVTDAMRIAAQGFAEEGIPALVPNMFWRADIPRALDYEGEDRATAWTRLAGFDKVQGVRDVGMAADWLAGKVGVSRPLLLVGFCGGGLWSYLAAATGRYAASASFYALGIAKHLDLMPGIKCPMQLHYGMVDPHVPRDEIDAVSAAASRNSNVEVHTYEKAGHSFANVKRPTYDADSTKLAMQRIREMIDRISRRT